MNRAVPRAHVIDRVRIWRLVAAVLLVAVAMTAIELWARPEAWRSALGSAAFPLVGAPVAWRLGPRLSPTQSFRVGLGFLGLGVLAATISLIGWLGTPMAGAVSFYYVLITVFAALFFHRRQVIGLSVASALAMAVGLLIDGFTPDDLLLWALAMSVSATTGVVLHDVRSTAEHLSYTDALTGAANRREWDLVVDDAVERHGRLGGSIAVLLIDVDDFKTVNDTGGHERGDEVLRDAVDAWRRLVRATDTLARIGGDEFGILLNGDAAHRAERLGTALIAAIEQTTGASCSIGVASTNRFGCAPLLVSAADQQLYLAKSTGRSRVCATEVGSDRVGGDDAEPSSGTVVEGRPS